MYWIENGKNFDVLFIEVNRFLKTSGRGVKHVDVILKTNADNVNFFKKEI